MLIPRIKRADPDKVFVIIKNDEASTTMVDGDAVVWNTAASKNYGVDALKNQAGDLDTAIGAGVISGADILVGNYGLCQVYGYHSNVKSAGNTLKAPAKLAASAGSLIDGVAGDGPGVYMGTC